MRLDCVVTVVSAEQWETWIPKNGEIEVTCKISCKTFSQHLSVQVPKGVVTSQLQCADVVLLNKKDLVDDDALKRISGHEYIPSETLKKCLSPGFIMNVCDGVSIYRTSYSRIGLQKIMDVSIKNKSGSEANTAVVTHEETEEV